MEQIHKPDWYNQIDAAVVFKRMAESSYYSDSLANRYGMCNALSHAICAGFVSEREFYVCFDRIDEYMRQLNNYNRAAQHYLRHALGHAGLPFNNRALFELYSDWDNRPQPWLKSVTFDVPKSWSI